MDVEAAEPGRVEHLARQHQPVGRDHRRVEAERAERRVLRRVPPDARGRADGQAEFQRRRMDRAGLLALPPPRRPRRLRVHAGDVVPGRLQRPQRGHRKTGAAHEGEPHGGWLRRAGFCPSQTLPARAFCPGPQGFSSAGSNVHVRWENTFPAAGFGEAEPPQGTTAPTKPALKAAPWPSGPSPAGAGACCASAGSGGR